MHSPPVTLVCFAVEEEARFFRRLVFDRPEVQVLITGIGRQNAERTVASALAHTTTGLVLSAGFAGGLRPGLAAGDVVFPGADEAGLVSALIGAGAQPARFHFSHRVLTSATEKRRLREATGADAVEMESYAICALCRERNIPSATVRVILDPAEDDLPLDFNQILTESQRIDIRKLAFALLKSPGKISALLRLRKQGELAAKELARVLVAVIEGGRRRIGARE